ncbi:hypothetical protein HF909_18370 (plasmid) [Ralstonia pseudosolanacearum]|uniref:Uncharacterized protein n=1 Tax=Ralstonia solanacearum TaxID=305 RepID=A0AA92K4M9_RALSL|nr:hypothetical protein [Ralstonia pseudosolanacearum]QOK98450.1 hypothetical protein HF909_18370 [Ralstonia pseudosolanacearum]
MQQRDHRQLDLFGEHAHPHHAQLAHQFCLVRDMQIDGLPNGFCPSARKLLDLVVNSSVGQQSEGVH